MAGAWFLTSIFHRSAEATNIRRLSATDRAAMQDILPEAVLARQKVGSGWIGLVIDGIGHPDAANAAYTIYDHLV